MVSLFLQKQHVAEVEAIKCALEAQREAMEELKLESEELYKAALKPDPLLFPFIHEGPAYTPPKTNYEAPDGKYNDITKVYTQWWRVLPVCPLVLCAFVCMWFNESSTACKFKRHFELYFYWVIIKKYQTWSRISVTSPTFMNLPNVT